MFPAIAICIFILCISVRCFFWVRFILSLHQQRKKGMKEKGMKSFRGRNVKVFIHKLSLRTKIISYIYFS